LRAANRGLALGPRCDEEQYTAIMKILIIDDESMVRETLATYLRSQGYQVRVASSGEEGLWMLEEATADLVFSDIKMPGLSGMEVLRRVRERWPATEVVLVTGYATVDHAVEALRLGAYDFLLKPVRLARLEILVRHCEERIRFSQDNRELREVVERLRELSARKEKFIALANHEIRTPTTVAAGLVSLLADRSGDLPEDVRRLIASSDRALRRLKDVVEDLGDLGLARGGSLDLQIAPHASEELLTDIEDLGEMYRGLRNLRIHVQRGQGGAWRAKFDRRKILRAVGALLQNAVKYTPDGGEVAVGVAVVGRDLRFEVSDTGVGVPREEEEKIFELFYEAADVRHHRTSGHEFGGGGLGVGLPLARAIAQAHGGGVEYRPRSEGGSVFTLKVPFEPLDPAFGAGNKRHLS
jgi:signal transduction histidine kinase